MVDKIKELDEITKIRSEKRLSTKNVKINMRRNNLIDALQEYKLELRDDSKLCHGYINGTIKTHTIPQIVERMCQMKFLYEYCDFDNFLRL